jgi:hypothetical protein
MWFSIDGAFSSKSFSICARSRKGVTEMQMEINGRTVPLHEIGKGA